MEERLYLLHLVAEGKLSPEEAERLLDALRASEQAADTSGTRARRAPRVAVACVCVPTVGSPAQEYTWPWEREDWQWPWEREDWPFRARPSGKSDGN